MEQVSGASILAMSITLVVSIGLPVALWIVFSRKMGKGVSLCVLSGALGFFIPQALVRIPILNGLALLPGFQSFITAHFWMYAILLAFTAGLFETTGRLVVFKTLLKRRTTYYGSMAAGLGHGGVEAAYLVGLTYVNNLVLSVMINSGNAQMLLSDSGLAGDQAKDMITALTTTTPGAFYLAGLERIFTIGLHIGLSVLLAYGITRKMTGKYFVLVLMIHSTIDFLAVMGQKLGLGLWAIELFTAAVGLFAIYFVYGMKDRFEVWEIPRDKAEIAVEEGY